MSKVKIVLNSGEIAALLKSEEVAEFVSEIGGTVRDRAGEGFSSDTMSGRYRAICRVKADSKEAVSKCFRKNTLLKALHK